MNAEGKAENNTSAEEYPQAFFTWLRAHPDMQRQLLHSIALGELKSARVVLENEYGWGKISEQQFFQAVITDLGPAAQTYFAEEFEDKAVAYMFDGYETTIKHVQIEDLD